MSKATGRLEGKVALVTGAARGQGAAEARRFAAEGASVVVTDVLDDVEVVAKEIGERALAVHHDVTDPAQWQAAVDAATEAFGALDVLVNNAGVFRLTPLKTATAEEFMDIVAINQLGVFLGMQAVIAPMTAAGGGSIINISSVAGILGSVGSAAYSATKFAVRGMTKVAALELARNKIRVNSIHPGMIDTMMLHDLHIRDDQSRATVSRQIPVGELARPDDIAAMALFLASDESSYCTGAEFVVDGGLSANLGLDVRG